MRGYKPILFAALSFFSATGLPAQNFANAENPSADADPHALLKRVIANQKKDEEALLLYERLQRQETRRVSANVPPEVKVMRMIPAGTGVGQIPVRPDGTPADLAAYRAELEKLEYSLTWAAEEGRAQHDAYDKIAKKQRDRNELIEATQTAFVFTFVTRELRGDRLLAKYRMEPNPAYKPTSRATAVFSRVHGMVWIDEVAGELARAQIEVMDDISIGGFIAKINKGSQLMQERYEIVPGVWMPSYSQYDFEGRKFFSSFVLHERTFYSHYRRIGAPKEALLAIRAELGEPAPVTAHP